MKKFKELFLFQRLNAEQLSELAKLYFDLARGSFALVVLQAINQNFFSANDFSKIITGIFWGLVFTYLPDFAGLVCSKILTLQ